MRSGNAHRAGAGVLLAALAGLSSVAVSPASADPIGHAPGAESALQGQALMPVGAPGIDPSVYAALFAGMPADPPLGAVIADTGFRAFPNGFSFVNYGARLGLNQRLFGQPIPLSSGAADVAAQGLTKASMVRVFGREVCLRGTGSACTLTETAKVVMSTAKSWAAAGHCFGLATVANALFTGKLPPSAVRGGAVNTLTTLNDSTQQAIMRAFIAQYFSARGIRPASMGDAISTLRSALRPGVIPFTLLIYGAPGGHALVPYALLDRGDGLFDIAVYDPSLPNQLRAVHVDTVSNAWSYQGAPGLPGVRWSSSDSAAPAYFLLGDVSTALARQACPFCQAQGATTLVSFSSVSAANGGVFDSIELKDSRGNPLPVTDYQVIRPSDDRLSDSSVGPVFRIRAGVNFQLSLDGSSVETAEPFKVTIISPSSTRSLLLETLSKTTRGTLSVSGRSGGLVFSGTPANKGVITHTVERQGATYNFSGTQVAPYHLESMELGASPGVDRVVFAERHQYVSSWTVRMRSTTATGSSTYEAVDIAVPNGARLVVRYSKWRGAEGRPRLWLDRGSDGSLNTQILLRQVNN